MESKIIKNRVRIWYMFCFLCLGIIDQRRGSAIGQIQMTFSNLTGIVIAMMLVPSLKVKKFLEKKYGYWTIVCIPISILIAIIGSKYWVYQGQWVTAVLNVVVWSYLIIYIWDNRNELNVLSKICRPYIICAIVMLSLMIFSVHGWAVPLWHLMIYGGFYLIGIPNEKRRTFLDGMLDGIIIWFFVLQIIAFGFRPYDYIRYHGLYAGETQNGLFYMLVCCAFLIKWMEAKEKKQKFLSFFFFFMAAGCISFTLFTGSRAALMGIAIVTLVVTVYYDIISIKKIGQWGLHGGALILCIAITVPIVYGCIRYLPTILHHPVWFQGEYESGRSICSFDSWNSDKYITFDEAMESNIGRILRVIGIDYDAIEKKWSENMGVLKVVAAELDNEDAFTSKNLKEEAGQSPDNPYRVVGIDIADGVMGARKVIYSYYLHRLNFVGHKSSEAVFYLEDGTEIGHAHNMFIQIAYSYGVAAGGLFLLIYLHGIIHAFYHGRRANFIGGVFLVAILCFGLVEMVITPGQITVPIMGIFLFFNEECGKEAKNYSLRQPWMLKVRTRMQIIL